MGKSRYKGPEHLCDLHFLDNLALLLGADDLTMATKPAFLPVVAF